MADQACVGFSTFTAFVRVMGTEENPRDLAAGFFEGSFQSKVDGFKGRKIEKATPDRGLVGEDDHADLRLSKSCDGFGAAGDRNPLLWIKDVGTGVFLVDDPIPVEQNPSALGLFLALGGRRLGIFGFHEDS